MASTQKAAEEIARRRAELERVADRGEQRIPVLEAQLVAAKAEKQRLGVARHLKVVRDFVPTLIKAVEAAAAVQVQAIALRQQAEQELGEGVVAAHIPHLAFAGLLLPDLVLLWRSEVERIFAPPAAAPPRPVAVSAPAKASPKRPIAAPPAPRPVRRLRQDPAPGEGLSALVFLRPNVELPDGTLSGPGDRINLPTEQARALVQNGAAEFFAPKQETANG